MIALENEKRVLYQWDLNQRVLIDGYEPGAKVEFLHLYDANANPLVVASYQEDGHLYAPVPNILLQKATTIRARVSPVNGDARLPCEKDIRVIIRRKPDGYQYTETPLVQVSVGLDEAMREIVREYAERAMAEMLQEMKSDPVYATMIDEVKHLNTQCKNYAILCNKILQDCNSILKKMGGDNQ